MHLDARYARGALFTLLLAVVFVFAYAHAVGADRTSMAFRDSLGDPSRMLSAEGRKNIERVLQAHIRVIGGRQAYAHFADAVQPFTVNEQHTFAHLFGSALYREEGEEAVGVCDQRFTAGCIHTFFADAIHEHGLAEIVRLYEYCASGTANTHDRTECEHGIGHGIMHYFGYDESGLKKALGICGAAGKWGPTSGCYVGVFMEYNEGFARDPITLREFAGDVYAPCDSLAGVDRMHCLYWQPNWWWKALAKEDSPPHIFERMGAYCEHLAQNADQRKFCYQGIGYAASWASQFDAERAREYCEGASSEPERRQSCLSVLAENFALHRPEQAEAICDGLIGDAQTTCIAHAHAPQGMPEQPAEL